MRSGTPGFVGARLREAREVRGLTAIGLAEIVGVSPQAISQYETGKNSPSPPVLAAIATTVNLPEHFFLKPVDERHDGPIFYRSMNSATKAARARAERRFSWLKDIVGYISNYVALPKSNIPAFGIGADPLLLSDLDIEETANELRRYWGMHDGPIANMVRLVENQGAIIARDRLGAETLDGLSQFAKNAQRPYIIIGIDKGSSVRWRFDVAHELGHMILHSRMDPQLLLKPEYFKKIEEQAHRFAAAFLLPLGPFGEDLFAANLDALRVIKPKWKVSIAMMITRARQGDFISEETARGLWINLARRKWRRNEPGDDVMPPEQPSVVQRSMELILEEGSHTLDDILLELALPAADVETLAALPSGYLSQRGDASKIVQPLYRVSSDETRTGQVVQLPLLPRTS